MRFWCLVLFLLLAVAGLVGRMIHLSVINRPFLVGQGEARSSRVIDIPAYRGMILDRNGYPLAISTPVDAIWVNPHQLSETPEVVPSLAKLLDIAPIEMKHRLQKNSRRSFLYVKHGVEPSLSYQVRRLNLPGVYFQREYRRYYPEGEAIAHVLGFTNFNDEGQEGIELAYNKWLAGVPGKRQVVKNRLGNIISGGSVLRQPQPGRDIVLSIDRRIQYIAYSELKAGVRKFQASSGTAIVLDSKTGEILAMVNQPSFNPNHHTHETGACCRNRAVTDIFEPGSTIKTFSMLTALLSHHYSANTFVDTTPGWFMVQNKKVQDARNYGLIDLTTILQKSSNVGMVKIILSLPPHDLWNTLHKAGFGEVTAINFPGERSGLLPDRRIWSPFTLATLSFGYGMSASALQLAQAFAIVANQGIKRPLSLLKVYHLPEGERIFDSKITQQLLLMLEAVLKSGGTAVYGNVPGYRVAGKTGTARLVGKYGYVKHRYNSSFIGIAPASQPRLIVAVILNDPKGKYFYAGETAAPIFSRIMAGALSFLNIPSDA